MKNVTAFILILLPIFCFCQSKNAKTIIVKGVGFLQVCNTLLDSGYTIETKDNELQTARTEKKPYPHSWNATYRINVRVKDSIVYFSASCTVPPTGTLFKDEPAEYSTNKKGKPQMRHLLMIPFLLMKNIAESFKKEISYL